MRILKRDIPLFILLAALAAYAYYYWQQHQPCAEPIRYSIGAVDKGFGVTPGQFAADIAQASALWSAAAGKPLFVFDPKGSLVINLVYDTRQQATQQEQQLLADNSKTGAVADSVKAQYSALVARYQSAKQDYASSVAAFNKAQSSYNQSIAYWNSRGGAPQKEYAALEQQKSDLEAQVQSLESKRQGVNALADQINALIDKYNLLVSHINTNIDAINNNGVAGTTFEEGVYIADKTGERINIYQFDSQVAFERVLAHELGHALGLGHNSNPDSIMNPVNASASLALTADDDAALAAACQLH